MELRVLILAPFGRDAAVIGEVLQNNGVARHGCNTIAELVDELERGAAAVVVTEESFAARDNGPVTAWLARQPAWSDLPFIVLSSRRTGKRSSEAFASLRSIGNLVLLERPVHAETLASAVASAVRARKRQYEMRQNLHDLAEMHTALGALNTDLEHRIAFRTRELAGANDRLMAEIAERRRVEQTLVQVQKMEAIGQLTGGIAHDFNNLLHVVSMNLDLVTRMSPEPRLAAVIQRATRAVGRGAKLTSQLLSFARANSLLPRSTEVNLLLQGMQDLVGVSVGSGVRVKLALHPAPLWARLDANQLEMAVLNLAVNAKDAMSGAGTLTITTAQVVQAPPGLPEGRYVQVGVADSGPGIPADLIDKVFEPFFTTKPLGAGTGLGLSQVYGFAQQSGGTALVDRAAGAGANVQLYFPAIAAPDVDAADKPADGGQARHDNKHYIVVVEDDEDVRRVICDSLQFSGHQVESAPDGEAGLALLRARRPDLLLVDYAMPGMTGADVIEQALRLHDGLPVILATGFADMAEVGRILGTQSVLSKPFDIAALLHAVDTALQQQPAH